MKYVVCTQQAPLALYDQSTLRDLGPQTVERLKLLERTDTLHFLSYVAPCMGRGDELNPEDLYNLLLVSGFQHDEEPVTMMTQDQRVIKGMLPSKSYPSLPVEISIIVASSDDQKKEDSPQCHRNQKLRMDSMRFQIIDAHKCI